LAPRCLLAACAAVIFSLTQWAHAALPPPGLLSHGRFKDVQVQRPDGEVKQVVLLLADQTGELAQLPDIAQSFLARGALVIRIDTAALFTTLEADPAACVFPDGDLENLSHYVQAYYKLPTYFTPVLIGYGAGGSLAYALLANSTTGTFAGAMSLEFCPQLTLRKPLCKGELGPRLLPVARIDKPWIVLQDPTANACPRSSVRDFVSRVPGAQLVEVPSTLTDRSGFSNWKPQLEKAYSDLTVYNAPTLPTPPGHLRDLPIIEVPATGSGNLFAVLLSGDGGWAGIDKDIAKALAARGVPVAGLDSLRYFWTARTPQGLSKDVDRVLRFYASRWKKSRAVLIGYSQGADVLPFAINRLPTSARSLLAMTALIGVSGSAAFEFHLTNWIGSAADGLPVLPEIRKLSSATTLCLYGDGDADSICPDIHPAHVQVMKLPGGHHFNGNYQQLAELILHAVGAPITAAP